MKTRCFIIFYLNITNYYIWKYFHESRFLHSSWKSMWLFIYKSIETSLPCLGNRHKNWFMERFFLMAFSKSFKRLKELCCCLHFEEFSEFAPLNVMYSGVTWYVSIHTLINTHFWIKQINTPVHGWMYVKWKMLWYFPKTIKWVWGKD